MKFDPEKLVINRPDLVPPGQKFTAWGITLVFWAALLYLWQPLISLLAWGLNIRLFYNHMILLGGYQTFLQLLTEYLQVIALLGGSLIIWARINQWRFRGNERRRHLGHTDALALQQEFSVTADTLDQAKNSRIVKISINPDGKVAGITLAENPQNKETAIASSDPMR